jgi:hypothetical protein
MVLVIANRFDPAANKLAQEWNGSEALGIITPRELISEGWSFDPLQAHTGTFIYDGGRAQVSNIHAVLVLLHSVQAAELADLIMEHDREYVAAEVTSFLLAWLTQLPCPIVNKPSTDGLAGQYWRVERWTIEAARAGLPISVSIRRIPLVDEPSRSVSDVVIVNGKAVSKSNQLLEERAARLAKHVGAGLIRVTFDDNGRFVWANPTPNLASDTPTRTAILEQLSEWGSELR